MIWIISISSAIIKQRLKEKIRNEERILPNILLVDDEQAIADLIEVYLKNEDRKSVV